MKKIIFPLCVVFLCAGYSFAAEKSEKMQGGTLGEYISQAPTPKGEEKSEEEGLLAPVGKPVANVIEGVDSIVEPLLQEQKIKDKKGETKATIKPKKGKVEFTF